MSGRHLTHAGRLMTHPWPVYYAISRADGELTISGKPTIVGDLSLEPDTTIFFDDNAELTVKGEVKAWGDLTLAGEGKLDAQKDVSVAGGFNGGEVDVIGTVKPNVNPLGVGDDALAYVQPGEILPIPNSFVKDHGYDKITVIGGGTLEITDSIELKETIFEEIALEDNSTLKINGTLKNKNGARIEITGSGSVKVVGEVEATDLSIGSGVILDLSDGSLSVAGDAILDGTLDFGNKGWEAVDLAGTITLSGSDADIKLNGQSKWYTIDGAKAKYSKVGNDVELDFITGAGNKVTPAGNNKYPTESITKVTSGVKLVIDKSGFYVENNGELIVEDNGILDVKKWWFDNFNSDLFKGSIIIKDAGNLKWRDKLAVGDHNQADWDSWAWKQNGTITEITVSGSQWKFTAKPGSGATKEIGIGYTGDVNSPIEISEGVTAVISQKWKQNTYVLTNKGTINVTGNLEIVPVGGIVFGTKDAGLIVKPNGTLKYGSNAWLGTAGVGRNGFVQIEGGSFVTLGGVLWFGPTPSNPSSYLNLESNVIVEIGDGLLTAYKKDQSSNEGNVLSARYISTNLATPNLDILVEKGVNFNIKDKFGSIGNLEIEGGASFTVEGSYAIGVRTYEKDGSKYIPIPSPPEAKNILTIHDGATFEIKANGKIETVGNGQIRNGTVDIKDGAIILGVPKIGEEPTEEEIKTFLKGKISDHTVIYKEETIKE